MPQGGRFDGPLGVVGGLEAVERTGRGTVVAFRGEEVGCIGSRALCAGGSALPTAFLELHIEQGPVLERVGAPLGVVTSIVGYARGELVFEGRGGPRGDDADGRRATTRSSIAAEAILRIREAALAIDGAVATVGQLTVEPGGSNVIPERVRISVDARAPDAKRLDELIAAIGFEPAHRTLPAAMGEGPRRVMLDEIESRGLRRSS